MEYDVFISYSRKDSAIVDQFVRALTDAGYRVWIDSDGIYSGDQFIEKIPKAIDQSTIVLFFSSVHSNSSKWTLKEINYAQENEKKIIPIRLDNNKVGSIQFLLRGIDFIPYNPQQPFQAIDRLLFSIEAQCGKPTVSAMSSPQTSSPSPEELYELGNSYYEKKDYERAIEYFRLAAEQGHAGAQNRLGNCYKNGQGVRHNFIEAVRWYTKAAEQGHAFAQNNLGNCYYRGWGVERDYNEAVKWFRKAAEQGNVYAQYKLGVCYYNGQGVVQDYREAAKWYRKAAEQGNATAQNNLGNCYRNGWGLRQDYKEAVKWYRKAVEQGNDYAQYNLGLCYYDGRGVEKDDEEAVEWYRKAAEKGNEKAIEALKRLGIENSNWF